MTSFISLTTRFPESKSCAIGLFVGLEVFEDQMIVFLSFKMERIPGFVNFKTPDLLGTGVSLFATQTTVFVGIFLYHMPMYLFIEIPGLKNPISKSPLEETMVFPSFNGIAEVIVSLQAYTIGMERETERTIGMERERCKMNKKNPFVSSESIFRNYGIKSVFPSLWVQTLFA